MPLAISSIPDIMSDDYIYELKFCEKVQLQHVAQVLMYAIQSGAPKSVINSSTTSNRYISRIPLILNIRTGDVTEVIATPRLISKLVSLMMDDVHPAGIIAFDFETTGINPESDAITEYSFYHTQLRTTVAHSLVNPQRPVPLEV